MKPYEWNPDKNREIQDRHGVSFEDIVLAIRKGKLVTTVTHPNQKKYPGQHIMMVRIHQYIFAIPYVEDEKKQFLKTVYPSRKFTKLLIKKGGKNEKRI